MFFGSVQIISRLGNQRKLLMFTLFSGRHIGGLGSIILRGTFRRISQLWKHVHTLNLENCLLYLLCITISWLYPLHGFWYFLLRDNKTHSIKAIVVIYRAVVCGTSRTRELLFLPLSFKLYRSSSRFCDYFSTAPKLKFACFACWSIGAFSIWAILLV